MIGQSDPTSASIDWLVQGGGLAMAAYLVFWLTRKLNGKFDRLADSVEKLNHNIETLVAKVAEESKP